MDTRLGPFPTQVERPEPLKFAWPIMVLPELFTTTGHLSVVIGYFATIGWEVYAPDLSVVYGTGAVPAVERLRFDDLVNLAATALAEITRPTVVVGHGIGGLIALKLAEKPGI